MCEAYFCLAQNGFLGHLLIVCWVTAFLVYPITPKMVDEGSNSFTVFLGVSPIGPTTKNPATSLNTSDLALPVVQNCSSSFALSSPGRPNSRNAAVEATIGVPLVTSSLTTFQVILQQRLRRGNPQGIYKS